MTIYPRKLRVIPAIILVLASVPITRAASLTWDAGTNRNWDTTTDNWVGAATWSNANPDQAIFGTVAPGLVTLTTAITANKLTFNTAGHTIAGNILTLGGTTPMLIANADATISSVLSGGAAIAKNGTGKLTLTGVNTLTGNVTVTQGTLELGGGGVLNRALSVSGAASNNAIFNLTGGSMTLNNTGSFNIGGASESGVVNISDGSLTLTGGSELTIGNATNAISTWNQTGGTVAVTTGNHIYTGMGTGAAVTTILTFSGGSFFVVPGNSATTFSIGGRSQTAVTVSGNAMVDSYQTRFGWGTDLTTTDGGTLNLDGGTWKTQRIYRDMVVQKAEVNLNGGSLQAGRSETGFMTGLTSANIKEGGAKIDTNAFDITIAQALIHGGTAAVDGGLTKSGDGKLTLTGTNTFTGPVTVNGGSLELSGTLPSTVAISATAGTFVFATPGQTAASATLGAGSIFQINATAATTVNTLTLANSTLKLSVSTGSYVPLQCTTITANGAANSATVEISGGITGAGTYHLIACPSAIGGIGFSALHLGTTSLAGYTLSLVQNPGFIDLVATETPLPVLENPGVSVALDPTFPQAIRFTLKSNGATLEAGDATIAHEVNINGIVYPATVTSFIQSANETLYTLHVSGFNLDIFYRFTLDGTVLTRAITNLTGTGEPNVQTLNLGTPLIRAAANQTGSSAAFVRNVDPELYANYSGSMAGDTIGTVTALATGTWYSTWCFVNTAQLVGTAYNNLYDYPFTVKVANIGGQKCAAIYDRDYNYRFKDIKPGVWFESKTCITGDANDNGSVDWQDGAIWVRNQLPPMLPMLADHYARGGAWQQSAVGYLGSTTYSNVTTAYPLYASQMRQAYHQTEGVPQSICCAGWTYRGHDWMWADWDQVVNPGGGGLAAYTKARTAATRYNGDLSFHLNQDLSAVESQHYDDMVIAKTTGGGKLGHYAYTGQNFYDISHFLDLQRGSLTGRINTFLDRFAPSPLVVYLDQMWNHPSALHGGTGAEEQYAKSIIVKTFRDRGTSTTTEGYQCSLFRNGMLQCKYRNNNVSHIDDFVTAGRLMWQFTSGSTTEFSESYYRMFGGKISQEFRSGNLFGSNNWMGNVMVEDTYLLTLMNACMRKYTPMEYTSDSAKYQVRWGANMLATVDKANDNFTLSEGAVTLADGTDRFLPAPDDSLKIFIYSVSGSYGRSWTLPAAWSSVTQVDRYELTESGRAFIDRLQVTGGKVKLYTPAKTPYILIPASGDIPTPGPVDVIHGKSATASSVQGTNVAANAVDGNSATAWTASTGNGSWLEVDLGRELEINRFEITEAGNAITAFRVQIDLNGTWSDVATGTAVGQSLRMIVPNTRSSRVRLCIDGTTGGVSIATFQVYADTNLAMIAAASASSNSGSGWGDDYVEGALHWGHDIQASRAMDGAPETYWRPVSETTGAWLQADLPRSAKVNRAVLSETGDHVTGFKLQSWDGSAWQDVHTGTVIGAIREINFAEVTTTRLRLWITGASAAPSINEFSIFDVGGVIPVEVPPLNLATSGTATQSTTYNASGAPQVAGRAIDGNTDGEWSHNSVSCTANGSLGWWEVNMLRPRSIDKVVVWWRNACFSRDRNVDLVIYDSTDPATRQELQRTPVSGAADPPNPVTIQLATPVTGQVVRLEHTSATSLTDPNDVQLCLAEVQVFGPPGGYEDWADEKGLSTESGRMDADPDGDGAGNLLEFAMGGEPLASVDRGFTHGYMSATGSGESAFVFTLATLSGAVFARGSNNSMAASLRGITYRIESTTNLLNWNESIDELTAVIGVLPAPPTGYEYHSFTPEGSTGLMRNFMRVKVSSP